MLYTLSWMWLGAVAVGDDLVVGDEHARGRRPASCMRHAARGWCRSSVPDAACPWGGRPVSMRYLPGLTARSARNLIAAFLAGFEAIAHHALTFIVRREFSSCSSIALISRADARHLQPFDVRSREGIGQRNALLPPGAIPIGASPLPRENATALGAWRPPGSIPSTRFSLRRSFPSRKATVPLKRGTMGTIR